MATITRGVVERANTIEENKQVLSELMRKNEFLEPSQDEFNKLFKRLNAENARELVKDMKSYESAWHNKKVTDRLYGPIPGIPCGSWWGIRMDCSRDRIHDPFIASVQCGPVGAVSICTSQSNEDVDLGDMLTFTAQSYADEDKEQDQENESLILNFINRVPVRIIRSYNLSNEYSPKTGVRYDGLYSVDDYWIGICPQSGIRRYKFALKRLFGQEPPPWKLKIPSGSGDSVPVLTRYSKNSNIQSQVGTASRLDDVNVYGNDVNSSRSNSTKKIQTRDRKTSKIFKSARKRRRRLVKPNSELEPSQCTSSPQGTTAALVVSQISPGRKIICTDHKNIHVSAIVTRRVSKKQQINNLDNKLLPDCVGNKSWNLVGGCEPQQLAGFNEGEEEGIKSQSTRLQNTNISIRTDLYDSSHNLKYNVKKSGSNLAHGTGIFKPRILGIQRRQLHFAGVDSSPGSSRTISSVKMERVRSIDTKFNKQNLNHSLCQEKADTAITEILPRTMISCGAQKSNTDISTKENQITKDTDITMLSSPISHSYVKDKDLKDMETLKNSCLHRIEHAYASQSLKSIPLEGNYQNLVNQATNYKEQTEGSRPQSLISSDSENDGSTSSESCQRERKNVEKTEFYEPDGTGSSESLVKEAELKKMAEKSLETTRSVTSPSQSPPFMGFAVGGSWSESAMMMNSLTFEKMLDIITEEKSSPMAKMLIGNVIGFPAFGSSSVFDVTHTRESLPDEEPNIQSQNEPESENPGSKISTNNFSKTKNRPSSMRTRSSGRLATLKSSNVANSPIDHEKLGISNSRQLRPFENSRQQNIIEIVYTGEEPDMCQESEDENCDSHTQNTHLTVTAENNTEKENFSTSDRESNCKVASKTTEFTETSNQNLTAVRQYNNTRRSKTTENHDTKFAVIGYKSSVSPPFCDTPEGDKDLSTLGKKAHFHESRNNEKTPGHVRLNLTMIRGKKDPNSCDVDAARICKQNDEESLKPNGLSLAKISTYQTTTETLKAQPPSGVQIITRSKYLQNSIHDSDMNAETSGHQMDVISRLNVTRSRGSDLNQSPKVPGEQISCAKLAHNSTTISGFCSTRKRQQFDDKRSKTIAIGSEGANLSKADVSKREEGSKSKSDRTDSVSKNKSSENIRLVKRSGVKMKRKVEIANLFIDMNMSPRSQISQSKSRKSLRDGNHSRRRSCPAVVDRGMKRRNNDPVKHPTSPSKRIKRSVQIQSSSVQIPKGVTSKKGLSLRKRTQNHASPSNNNNNNNNNKNNNNSVKRIEKAEKVITKINKPIKSSARNLVANKNTVHGLRTATEIPKRREVPVRTRSRRSPRGRTVGRLGLRRALLPGTETYARKKKKKKEKQMVENAKKQKTVQGKQPPPKNELIKFALNKTKLDYNIYKGTEIVKKPKMVSVMTQCNLIPDPSRYSAAHVAAYRNSTSNERNLRAGSGYLENTDNRSECVLSSRKSSLDEIKNEIIELIEIKSETIDDDIALCDEEDDEIEKNTVQTNSNSAYKRALIRLRNYKTNQALDKSNIEGSEVQNKSYTPSMNRLSQSSGAFNDQRNGNSVPKRGFVRYIAGHRTSASVPIRSVEGNLRIAQLKSIGFKPIKPGVFPPDGFQDASEYNQRSTSDSPRIAYSSGVVKRGVHEEYDKYTSEENNVVQYMDNNLCYEDIENEDILFSGSKQVFVEEMKFHKLGTEMLEESNDNSLQEGFEDEDEEDEDEELQKEDIKEWQSQLDANSSNSEDAEAVVDSDGDMPWRGW